MKNLLLILLMLPMAAGAQTQENYEQLLGRFVACYNDQRHSDLCSLFPSMEKKGMECHWSVLAFREYGKILSYKYLGVTQEDPGHVTVFKVVFEHKNERSISFTLDGQKNFGTFRFDTSTEEIEKMLAAAE